MARGGKRAQKEAAPLVGGVCPFCLVTVPEFKRNSHIVPRWMHDGIKDPVVRNSVKVTLSTKKVVTVQDGDKVGLWCAACEKVFADYDRYGSFVLGKGKVAGLVTWSRSINWAARMSWFEVSRIDTPRLRRFFWSIALRAHIAGQCNLREHFQNMLAVYRSNVEPNDWYYPVSVVLFTMNSAILSSPSNQNRDGYPSIECHCPYFFFDIHLTRTPVTSAPLRSVRLRSNGTMLVPFMHPEDTGFVRNAWANYISLAVR